jgi:hypothetical protein
MKSKPVLKAGARSQFIREKSGDWIMANYWVSVGLTRNQRAALAALAKAYGFRNQPVAQAARWLVMLGLDCLPILEARGQQLGRYADAEGFPTLVHLLDGRAKRLAEQILCDFNKPAKRRAS